MKKWILIIGLLLLNFGAFAQAPLEEFIEDRIKNERPDLVGDPEELILDPTSPVIAYRKRGDILEKLVRRELRELEKKQQEAEDLLKDTPEYLQQVSDFANEGITFPQVIPIPIPVFFQKVLTVNSTLEDTYSSSQYTGMLEENAKSILPYTGLLGVVNSFSNFIEEEREAIENIHPTTGILKSIFLDRLLKDWSPQYFRDKYPLFNPRRMITGTGNRNVFKNGILRARYRQKINRETRNIDNYLDEDNPVTEGQRIYLMLNAVKNVIKFTLEDDEY